MPDDTALATVAEASAFLQEWSTADWGEFEAPEGVAPILPEIRIVQKAVANIPGSAQHGGDFWFSDTGLFASEITGTIVISTMSKVLFDEDSPNAPVCSSLDGRVPRPGGSVWTKGDIRFKDQKERQAVLMRAPAACAVCPFNQWMDRKPPPCRDSYMTLFEVAETGGLYRLRFNGNGIGPFRHWLGTLMGSSVKRGAQGKMRATASQTIRITTVQAENAAAKWTWFEPRIDVVGDTPVEEAASYALLIKQIRPSFQRTLEETEGDLAQDYPAAGSSDTEDGDGGWGSGSGAVEASGRSTESEATIEMPPANAYEGDAEAAAPAKAGGRRTVAAQPGLGGAVDPDELPFE